MMKNMVMTTMGDIDDRVWNEYIMEAETAEYIYGDDPVGYADEEPEAEDLNLMQLHMQEKSRHARRRKKGYTIATKRSKWDTSAFIPGCEAEKYSQLGRYVKGHSTLTYDRFAQRSAIRRDQASNSRLADYYAGDDYSLTTVAAEFALCCDPGEKPVDHFINSFV